MIASDIMTFAYLHARVRLTFRRAPAFKALGGYEEALSLLASLKPTCGHIYREYCPAGTPEAAVPPRAYFTAENAGRLDSIVVTLSRWLQDGVVSDDEHVLLRHDIVLAANRVANIAGTYGHFRSKWSPSSLADLRLVETEFSATERIDHIVRQGTAERVARHLKADLCYLDPPYTKRQYAANYHLPETLARCDEPPAVGASGLRPWRDQYSDFCSKIRIRDSLRTIVGGMQCKRFLLSYSEDGLLTRSDMESVLGEFGTVEVIEFQMKRFRSQPNDQAQRDITEYVFDLQRR